MAKTAHHNLKGQSLELLQQYRQEPSTQIRNQIVQLNLGLVRKEVYHWLEKCNESYDDLLQVGSMGLIRAIERFDASKGVAFSSFAIPYIAVKFSITYAIAARRYAFRVNVLT